MLHYMQLEFHYNFTICIIGLQRKCEGLAGPVKFFVNSGQWKRWHYCDGSFVGKTKRCRRVALPVEIRQQ